MVEYEYSKLIIPFCSFLFKCEFVYLLFLDLDPSIRKDPDPERGRGHVIAEGRGQEIKDQGHILEVRSQRKKRYFYLVINYLSKLNIDIG